MEIQVFNISSTNRPAWENLVSSAEERLELSRLVAGDLLSIDDRVKEPWPEVFDPSYRPQHVEVLLDQAADLLDRGLRDRAQWQELYEKWFAAALAVKQADLEAGITARELHSEHSDVSQKVAEASKREVDEEELHLETAEGVLHNPVRQYFTAEGRDNLIRCEYLYSLCSNIANLATPIGNYEGSGDNRVDGLLQQMNRYLMTRQFALADYEKNVRFDANTHRQAAINELSEAYAKKAEYERLLLALRKEKLQADTLINDAKKIALTTDGAALDYVGRMNSIEDRYREDFREALKRIQAASVGLSKIYGYTKYELPPTTATGAGFFDSCVSWVRAAINFVVNFQRLQQQHRLTFSIKGKTKGAFEQMAGAATWTFEVSPRDLPFDSEDIPITRHIRLQGISVAVRHDQPSSALTYAAFVDPPNASYCFHLDGKKQQLDQSQIKPVISGRVVERSEREPLAVLGATELLNASPFGQWTLKLVPTAGTADLSRLADIEVDLMIATRIVQP